MEPLSSISPGDHDVPTRQADSSSNLSTRILNVLQALVLAALLGFAHILGGLLDTVNNLRGDVRALSATVQDANLPQMHDDVTTLKIRQEWVEARLNTHRTLPSP
jgi:hypothetical protein